jgi:hypothetical protein
LSELLAGLNASFRKTLLTNLFMNTQTPIEGKKPAKDSQKTLTLKADEAKRLAEQAKKHFRMLKADYKLARKAYKQARKAAKRARKEAKVVMKLATVRATRSVKTRNRPASSTRKSKELTSAPTVTSTALPQLPVPVQTATTGA